MNIQTGNKFKEFFKKYGVYMAAVALILVISLSFGISALVNRGGEIETGSNNLKFVLPMSSPTIVKDYSSTELQENETLNQWEAHKSIDFTSEVSLDVFSVLSGKVTEVKNTYLEGNIVVITHSDGFVSTYASLGKEILVKQGDKVKTGQKIGTADNTATAEADLGKHLHFVLSLNGKKVDPNNYLDLQNK